MGFYKDHRAYLVVAIAQEKYQMERTDERSNAEHRAQCRTIYNRLIVELNGYDTTQIEEALAIEAAKEAKRAKKGGGYKTQEKMAKAIVEMGLTQERSAKK